MVLVARSTDKLTALADELGQHAIARPLDAADPMATEALATEIGCPDVLINAAGAGRWLRLDESDPESLEAMMRAPFFAALQMTRAFLPAMLNAGKGAIIQINSPASIAAWPNSVGYTSARWALRGLHEALSQDLAQTGVSTCHIIFGSVASGYFDNNPGVRARLPWLDRFVRTMSPEECAEIIFARIERPKHQSVHPRILRVFLALQWLAPRFVARLLRR